MSVPRFNNGVFSQLFNYNNINVIEWARNVYNKIKGDGILPQYVEREKGIDESNINITNAVLQPLLETNTDFTFDKCISSQDIPLEKQVNIGINHTIEFEINNLDYFFFHIMQDLVSNLFYIDIRPSSIKYVCGGEEVEFGVGWLREGNKIKFIRVGLSVSCYVDTVLIDTLSLNTNSSYVFNTLIKTLSIPDVVTSPMGLVGVGLAEGGGKVLVLK